MFNKLISINNRVHSNQIPPDIPIRAPPEYPAQVRPQLAHVRRMAR